MISRKVAQKRFERFGFNIHIHQQIFDSLLTEKGALEDDFRLLENSVQWLGAEAISSLSVYSTHLLAFKQLNRRDKQSGQPASPRNFLILLHLFSRPLGRMIRSPFLQRKGYGIRIHASLDRPFSYVFSLQKIGVGEVARLNFELFLTKKNVPSIIIGNMQGRRKSDIDEFKAVLGESPLNYMTQRARKAFHAGNAVALNPKRFQYYHRLEDHLVASGMYNHQSLTGRELIAYMDFLKILRKDFSGDESRFTKRMLAARDKVAAEKERIMREGIGMHTAAFKKAGFKKSKKKYWKQKRALK